MCPVQLLAFWKTFSAAILVPYRENCNSNSGDNENSTRSHPEKDRELLRLYNRHGEYYRREASPESRRHKIDPWNPFAFAISSSEGI